ncbi:MAG: sodium:proton antiporter NhaD [Crocinitomicaceae bacterium]|nr:sodium:proton antiporter NhaD [Crocinitomicaceae bacterium]MDG1777536.1 sodium:proton antiporter NhaD [Crocinitomicaceae bacterium]
MEIFIVSVFILGYLAITLEHSLRIDKLIPALIMMALAWAGIAFGLDNFTTWFDSHNSEMVEGFASLPLEGHHGSKFAWFESTLLHHFGKTCEILIFLVGAMTIVEIIDHFNGFQTIKRIIKTNKKATLLWIVCALGFILSAIIDNLTATIVLITILRKLIKDTNLRMWYAGLIIIAANAGGAWSPIGDVTTTMLWMGDKVSAIELAKNLLLPSLVCMIIPTLLATFLPIFKGEIEASNDHEKISKHGTKMLIIGLGMIVFVPIFKTVTHLPPYVGMMLSLGIVSLVAEFVSNRELSLTTIEDHDHVHGPTFRALSKIEMPSILFFLGILMTVAALESLGLIFMFGNSVVDSGIDIDIFILLLGVGSAIIDNVPLVAASMGMFQEATDHTLWHFIAYAAGTGGSMLIIGSAAGVVAMGMEKISFFWYFKKIAWLALIGYVAGAVVFLFM